MPKNLKLVSIRFRKYITPLVLMLQCTLYLQWHFCLPIQSAGYAGIVSKLKTNERRMMMSSLVGNAVHLVLGM